MASYCSLFLVLLVASSARALISLKKGPNPTFSKRKQDKLPLVITTWGVPGFQRATEKAWKTLEESGNRVEAVVAGCSECERLQCDGSVGFGNHPDDHGETTLDALLMDGPGQKMGAVGDLRRVKEASRVAWAVMNFTRHSFLVGESATAFAAQIGFQLADLSTNSSRQQFSHWKQGKCQPNYWKNVSPDPKTSCGPYKPLLASGPNAAERSWAESGNHDTIGIVVVDGQSDVAVGTSTNGAGHKIQGRVGDSPIAGAGAYVDNEVGGAAATGDGDVMMRFLPSYQAVEGMRNGLKPGKAAQAAIWRIKRVVGGFSGAVIAADRHGRHGAACHGFPRFRYCLYTNSTDHIQIMTVDCI